MTIEEFWDKCYMSPSSHSDDTVLWFNNQFISSGSGMRMKMEQDELLKRLIKSGEVVL